MKETFYENVSIESLKRRYSREIQNWKAIRPEANFSFRECDGKDGSSCMSLCHALKEWMLYFPPWNFKFWETYVDFWLLSINSGET